MKVAVIGADGQLGTDLLDVISHNDSLKAVPFTHKDIDVSIYDSCIKIADTSPDVVINTAAFHKTDICEEEPVKAFEVNAVGSYNVARICNKLNAVYVYISTDYVFSGEKGSSYTEEDFPLPLNVYGVSKLAGERMASLYASKYYVVRSSSLFGKAGASGKGGNFVETIIKKAQAGEEVKVVNDVWMTPTYTKDLAETISKILSNGLPDGVYHVANSGSCTWWEFAKEIVKVCGFDIEVKGTTSAEYQSKAKRPKNSSLTSSKLGRYDIGLRSWKEALSDYLRAKGHLK